jgi:hypothetical protein
LLAVDSDNVNTKEISKNKYIALDEKLFLSRLAAVVAS